MECYIPRQEEVLRIYKILLTPLLKMSYQYDNEYVLSHYPPVSHSYHACLASLGYIHNQTGNIYSHLFGAGLFLFWARQTYNDLSTRYPTSDRGDVLAFGVFFAGAIICFVLSAIFHTLGSHSQRVYHTWLLLDLYGIFVVMVATVFSATFYGFYCERFWWKFYSVGVSAHALFLERKCYCCSPDHHRCNSQRDPLHKLTIPQPKVEKGERDPSHRHRLVRRYTHDTRCSETGQGTS